MPPYTGRFAPSPSGPLHMGSLLCALASYLDAKQNQGRWLVRMEDIDPPREAEGAQKSILATLQCHGLHWDNALSFQSQHSGRFNHKLQKLSDQGLAYRCNCTRKRLNKIPTSYDNHCRQNTPQDSELSALRLNIDLASKYHQVATEITWKDDIQGIRHENITRDGDFLIHRKGNFFAYQLAVVADDMAQGITHVVRGYDLIDCCAKQIFLTRILGGKPPRYSHIPVLVGCDGTKLSKQTFAPAVDNASPVSNIKNALSYFGLTPPAEYRTVETMLRWAIEHWSPTKLQALTTIPAKL